jgi:hypothetical protein
MIILSSDVIASGSSMKSIPVAIATDVAVREFSISPVERSPSAMMVFSAAWRVGAKNRGRMTKQLKSRKNIAVDVPFCRSIGNGNLLFLYVA